MLSCCLLGFSRVVWVFVIGPSQISSFFSSLLSSVIDILNVQYFRFTQSYEKSIKKGLDERNTHAKYESLMSYGKFFGELKLTKCRSNVTVKGTCSKFIVSSKRSCRVEHTCQI